MVEPAFLAMPSRPLPPSESIESLLERRSRVSGRDEARLTTAVAHRAIELFEAGALDPQQIERVLPVMQEAIALRGFPEQIARAMAKMRGALLRHKGLTGVVTLAEIKGKASVEGGILAFGDAGVIERLEGIEHEQINAGLAFALGTGGDGVFTVTVRAVEAPEPVLTESEYRQIDGSTQVAVIDVPGGRLCCREQPKLVLSVAPGRHAICAFRKKRGGYLVVLGRTEAPLGASLRAIETLEAG